MQTGKFTFAALVFITKQHSALMWRPIVLYHRTERHRPISDVSLRTAIKTKRKKDVRTAAIFLLLAEGSYYVWSWWWLDVRNLILEDRSSGTKGSLPFNFPNQISVCISLLPLYIYIYIYIYTPLAPVDSSSVIWRFDHPSNI